MNPWIRICALDDIPRLGARVATQGGEAIAVLNLDGAPSEDALKEVRAHPAISSVSVVKLPPAGQTPPWFG